MKYYSKRRNDEKLRRNFLYIAGISLIPFLIFAFIGYTDWTGITATDYEIGTYFYNLRTPMRNAVAVWITRLADREAQTLVTVVAVLFLLAVRKWRTGLWYGLTVLIGSNFLNSFVKNIFQRVRPEEIDHLVEQGGYAYPSGHAMGGVIVYGGLLFLLIRYFNTKYRDWQIGKWLLSLFIGLLILAIGLSRIYLGVHFPSDVIGGFSLGLSWLSLSIAIFGLSFTWEEFQPKSKYSFKKLY